MFNQTNADEKTVQSKLSTIFIIVAVVPMALLLAGFFAAMFQPVLVIGALFCQVVGLVLGWKFGRELVQQSSSLNDKLQKMKQNENNVGNRIEQKADWKPAQGSFDSLVSQMQQIATGNLEVSVDVKNDVTGPIATSVNQMTQQLRSIAGQVKSASNQVAECSSYLRNTSASQSQENDSHTKLVKEASQQIVTMTDSFQKVADMTRESVQVAIETRQSATKGQKAVAATVDGMHRIRNQVQSTSKRIKRLGESSQEIGEIVQMISDISDRTSILALNASIQASMAGDAGQGFAVIAEEIERLAERSSDATLQISKLIRAVQNETGEVISDMEESTREVVAGSQLAAEAGETLFEIDSVSNQLVELIQSSSNYALQQTDFANKIAGSMTQISASTEKAAQHSRESIQAIGMLDDLVRKQSDSIKQFKVSVAGTQSPAPRPTNSKPAAVAPVAAVTQARQVSPNNKTKAEGESFKFKGSTERMTPQPQTQPQPQPAEPKQSNTPAKMAPREPQQTIIRKAPEKTAKEEVGELKQPEAQTGKKPPMSNEELLRKVREAKARSEARKAKAGTGATSEQPQGNPPRTQTPVSGTLVMGDNSAEKPGVIDEDLLKKAQDMLKEVNKGRTDDRPETGAAKSAVSRTLNMDDM